MSVPATERRWQDVVMLIFGVWMLVSPFVLQYVSFTDVASVNSYVLGILVIIFSVTALNRPQEMWEEWINLLLGIWLIISPFLLRFGGNTLARWNHVILGILIILDALWVTLARPAHRPVVKQ